VPRHGEIKTMHYNFIEIGTSNFDTLIEKANDTTVGISIEPIINYINELPNKKNVKKLNVAVSFDDSDSFTNVYYIPKKIIEEYNLPKWTVGCNAINDYHNMHKIRNLQHLVSIERIKQIPIKKIFIEHNVTSLELLKIDTEGGDYKILQNLFKFLTNNINYSWPVKIVFESNKLTPQIEVNNIISLYNSVGYKLIKRSFKNNTVLIKNDNT